MTPVGHSLCGLAIATLAIPSGLGWKKSAGLGVLFIAFANAPDFPFPGWGHDRYEISHSFLVTGANSLVLALCIKPFGVPWRLLAGLIIAWFSHIVLDSTYNHGFGLGVMWPVSEARLAMPLPWFETLRSPVDYFTPHSVQVMSIELLVYGIVLVTVLLFRRLRHFNS